MKSLSLSALLAAGVLAGMTAANAADLGGNCCADLEERIAELEATTARKGNRKVSLTISGWVGQQLMVWDDGVRTKAYVTDLGTTLASHVKFTGSAAINSEWSAGYVLHIEAEGNDPLFLSQKTSNFTIGGSNGASGGGVAVLQSFWFLKSNSLGKLSIGKQSSAADNVAILPDGSGSLVPANYVLFDNNSFGLRLKSLTVAGTPIPVPGKPLLDDLFGTTGKFTWGQLATCPGIQIGVSADCDGVPNNNVRYDSPTFGGFSASWSWGEADIWAVAGRYAGEFNNVKLAAAIAYTESTNTSRTDNGGNLVRVDAGALQIGAYVQHIPTGLFVYGAYGKDYNNKVVSTAFAATLAGFGVGPKVDGDNWYLKAGIRQKWHSLGASVLYGEYGENNNKQSIDLYDATATGFALVTGSQVRQWGLGYVQEIDAAAMSLWITYRHFDAEANGTIFGIVPFKAELQSMDLVKVGGMINF